MLARIPPIAWQLLTAVGIVAVVLLGFAVSSARARATQLEGDLLKARTEVQAAKDQLAVARAKGATLYADLRRVMDSYRDERAYVDVLVPHVQDMSLKYQNCFALLSQPKVAAALPKNLRKEDYTLAPVPAIPSRGTVQSMDLDDMQRHLVEWQQAQLKR